MWAWRDKAEQTLSIATGEGGDNGIKPCGNIQQCNQMHWNREARRRTAELIQAQQNYIISWWSSLTPRQKERKCESCFAFGYHHKDHKVFFKHDLILKLWDWDSQKQDGTGLMKKKRIRGYSNPLVLGQDFQFLATEETGKRMTESN